MTQQTHNTSYVDDYAPPTMPVPTPMTSTPPMTSSTSSSQPQSSQSQALEDQNIFHLLGIQNSTEEEKEMFLDELQQVIWEDFLENDVELLITEEEMVEFKKITAQTNVPEEERQNQMVTYLEKLIPDLEKIMLEKALELKEEMVRERIKELQAMNAGKPAELDKIDRAKKMIDTQQQWFSAAELLNTVPMGPEAA